MTPEQVDQALAAVGAFVERRTGARFHLNAVSTRIGVSAFNVNTFIGADAVPVAGLVVVNLFPDGNGDQPQFTDGSGAARFMYGPSSALSTPGAGLFTVFATDSASKSEPPNPRVSYGAILSDVVHSLGDFGAEHTEIYLQFLEAAPAPPPPPPPPPAEIVLLPPLVESIRNLAWGMRGVSWDPDAALYNVARERGLGYPLGNEFEFLFDGSVHVAQLYALGVLYCVKGDWQNVHLVTWL